MLDSEASTDAAWALHLLVTLISFLCVVKLKPYPQSGMDAHMLGLRISDNRIEYMALFMTLIQLASVGWLWSTEKESEKDLAAWM